MKEEIHPKAFRLKLFKGHRQNAVEMQPNWFINRKAEFSLVETVANKKGFRRSESKSSHWLKQLANGKSLRGLGDLRGVNEFFLFAEKGIQRFDESCF